MSRISKLKTLLTNLEKMEDAGIKIPENLLQAIDSLAGQLRPFLEDSPQKAELDALERRESIKDIYRSLWIIFYNNIYQGILLDHNKFYESTGYSGLNSDNSVRARKEDISTRMTQIHYMLVAQWKFPIPPLIEKICLSAGRLTHKMLSYYEEEEKEYGYQREPSLAQDVRPLTFEEYVDNQHQKKCDGTDLTPKDNWNLICSEFTTDDKSYNFLRNPQSDTTLGEEAMKMYGSMTYEKIFTLLNKEYGDISEHFWVRCASNDDDN